MLAASRNLIFVSCLAQDNYIFSFHKDFCTIYLENIMVGHDFMINSLYQLHVDVSINLSEQIVSVVGSKRFRNEINPKYMWHLKLSYIGEERINRLEKDRLLDPLTIESYPVYESCL